MTGHVPLLIDIREKTPLVFSDAMRTEIVTLPTGDYSVASCTDIRAWGRLKTDARNYSGREQRWWQRLIERQAEREAERVGGAE